MNASISGSGPGKSPVCLIQKILKRGLVMAGGEDHELVSAPEADQLPLAGNASRRASAAVRMYSVSAAVSESGVDALQQVQINERPYTCGKVRVRCACTKALRVRQPVSASKSVCEVFPALGEGGGRARSDRRRPDR